MDACMIRSNLAQELGTGVVETFTLHLSKRAPNNPTVKGNQLKDSPKRSRRLEWVLNKIFPQIFMY